MTDAADFFGTLEAQMRAQGFVPPDGNERTGATPGAAARGSGVEVDMPQLMTLTEVDGVLRWEDEGGLGLATSRRSGRRGGGDRRDAAPRRDIVRLQMEYERLEASKIATYLEDLDRRFSTFQGLRCFDGTSLASVDAPAASGRVLLIVHGTFSNTDHLFDELRELPAGRRFLEAAVKKYDQVLAFDHYTLSMGPVMNALDLARHFAASKAAIDVISHSRGGLVSRWWLEHFDHGAAARRLVLVGSPLGGTSLAAAPNLRNALNLLTNVARAIGGASTLGSGAMPLLGIVSGLLKVITSVTSVATKTPLVDAAIAMIPGLGAQARVDNNFELARLRLRSAPVPADYYAIRSEFPARQGGVGVLEVLHAAASRATSLAADLVFRKPNDLVVDTDSMTYLDDGVRIPAARLLDYRKNGTVHHMNYFRQPRTVKAIRKWYGV